MTLSHFASYNGSADEITLCPRMLPKSIVAKKFLRQVDEDPL